MAAPMPRRQRRHATLLVVAVAVYLLVVLVEAGGADLVTDVDNVVECAAALLAATACFGAARRADAHTRRSWLLLGAGTLSWGLGQCVWTYHETIAGEAPFPSFADLGFLVSIPLLTAGLLTFPSDLRRAGRVRSVLDGLTIACACIGISWILVLDRVASTSGTGLDLVLALAYPVGDIVIIVVSLTVLSRARAPYRPTVVTLIVGACLLTLADSAFAYLATTDTYTTSPFNTGWVAGFLVIAFAARWGRVSGAGERTSSEAPPEWLLMLPYLPMAVFVLLAIPMQVRVGHLEGVYAWAGVPLVLLLLVRQTLVHRDNTALTRRLEDQIQALANSREDLRHQALHDPLTGLPNRSHLMRELAARFDGSHPPQSALLLMDLDRFKEINDGLGHDVGDRVLREVASRLHAATPSGDTVVRLGGDEFALLIDDPPGEGRPGQVAARLLAALDDPVELDGLSLSVGVSIGICHSADADRATAILQAADVAMYRAKREGRAIAVFGSEDEEDRPGRLVLLNDMRTMLERHELEVHYQPQIEVGTGLVVGVEALARWHHPTQGWVPPDQFIPFAEQTGMIGEVTSQVLRQALAQCARWRDDGLDLSLSVNLSPKALLDPHFARGVHDAVLGARLPSRCLTLEVTESAFSGQTDLLVAHLDRLRTLGVRLSIDDFGTGYSSMSYLKRLPVHELKIDRSFITDLAVDPDDRAIVASIVSLATTLGLTIVAEGVEDEPTLALVRELGCDRSQGYHHQRPATADALSRWLADQPCRRLTDGAGPAPTPVTEAGSAPAG
ncbi:MAG: EAL domain-containing protein [Acidimicrobiales bacterium]|nr:EAL domain-containing protein [Acidimicrobiales bacterium]